MSESERNEIPVRKLSLPFDGSIPRHWFGGNAMQTHVFNGLNLVFPEGERFFVRSVMDHVSQIEDRGLLAQVKGFAGQEGHHAHEHERYFSTLREQGYQIDGFLGRFTKFNRFCSRYLPVVFRLAVTAGAEHYTATLGAFTLRNSRLGEAHPVMRRLITWHAVEEIEHKSVAFDVLHEVNDSYLLRTAGFVFATAVLLGWAAVGTRMLLRQDGIGRAEARAMLRDLDRRDNGAMRRAIRAGVMAYFRRDFHPSENDDLELAHSYLGEIGIAA